MAYESDKTEQHSRKWQGLCAKLKDFLTVTRYEHSLRVSKEAAKLSIHYGLDVERAQLAGLLHDVARDFSADSLIAYANRFGIPIGSLEQINPLILHAPVGAAFLKNEWGLDDKAVLRGVAQHTVAAPGMDDFCQIVYLADIIEPGRREWPGLLALRNLSYRNLGRAMLLALEESFNYLRNNKIIIHPQAIEAYDFFLREFLEQESKKK
ncbi:MAG: bis(5'-nucleosyl)-tetraphosphatase (symmetrical) YqeK [Clostridiales bacterium]|nr:bis(5'-nucleosyl)-tetraphosphatase (symmetrical) YqeK [Clostridiales bacterium]